MYGKLQHRWLMRIDKKTLMADLLPLLNGERLEYLLQRVPAHPLDKPVLNMTVGEYIEALDKEWPLQFFKCRTAFEALGKLKQYRKEMEDVAKFIEFHSVPMDAGEKAAMVGIDFPTAQESILLTCLHEFGCPCIDSVGIRARRRGVRGAADIPLAEYLLVLKEKSSAAKYERVRAARMTAKMKQKGGRR